MEPDPALTSTALEPVEEALTEGDVALTPAELRARPGTARSALRSRDFRRLWVATFSSNVGTWMQNVALGAFAYQLSRSASFVALVGFAQLGPLLVLAPVGGLLADVMDRRRLLVATNLEQLVFSAALAAVAAGAHPSRLVLLLVVLAIGIGNALTGPPLASLLPNLVPRVDLPGAISLQSVQMNLSRVVGPAAGGFLLPAIHASGVFAFNAGTYLFAVVGALSIRSVPMKKHARDEEAGGMRRLLAGVAVARRDPLVRLVLVTIATISFFCLPFIGLMPVLAAQNLHMDVTGVGYGLLYASFGLGAAAGAVAVGSLLVGRPEQRVTAGLVGFAGTLGAFAVLHSPTAAYPVVFAVGFTYFATVTTLSTRLQQHLDDAVRGRVTALYMMGFGGTVPLGLLAGGALATRTSVTAVVLAGAVVAAALAVATRPRAGRVSRSPATAGSAGA